jgi:putative SOS response-associated peptidase YedK
MCNEYQKRYSHLLISESFSAIHVPITWASAQRNAPWDEPVKPTNLATIVRPLDPANPRAGLQGIDLRWWLVPSFHKGATKDWKSMATNARIETVDTAPTFRGAYKARRCLVPVSSFIEYSEPPGWKKGQPKQRNEIYWAEGEVRYFAGLWEKAWPSDFPEGLESFTFVTAEPSSDVAHIHDRQPPVLTAEQGME